MNIPFRRITGLLVTAIFLLSYLALIASGISKYQELRREGWLKTCPEVIIRSSDIFVELPDSSQVRHDICEWLRQTSHDFITYGVGWSAALLIILILRLIGGKSLSSYFKIKWLLLSWLVLLIIWCILPLSIFGLRGSILVCIIPILLPISWQVALNEQSKSLSAFLIFTVLSLLSVLYILAVALGIGYRPMYWWHFDPYVLNTCYVEKTSLSSSSYLLCLR